MADPISALGYFCLGIAALRGAARSLTSGDAAFALEGVGDDVPGSPDDGQPLVGEDARARALLLKGQSAIIPGNTKGSLYSVTSIEERVRHIKQRIEKGSLMPAIREAAIGVLSRKCETRDGVRWCTTPKDHAREVATLYKWVQDARSPIALRYVRDHVKVDQFSNPDKILRARGDDCDGGTILLGSMLQAVGYPVRMRVIQDVSSPSWSHIYLLVQVPPGRGKWVPLDWSVYPFKPAGWEAPGAAEVARTGKPAGVVVKLKDFAV